MNLAEASRILLSTPKVDASRITGPIEAISNLATVDDIIRRIEQHEQRPNNHNGVVGVALIQSAYGGRYQITAADEAVPGRKIGKFDIYAEFWPKSYFLALRQMLLSVSVPPAQYA